jgi:AraC family transcriptional regulator
MGAGAYADRVHRVMDHVRAHLDADLSLEALARVACFSPYHFHRIFRVTTGETLTQYIQRARLERACYLMKASPRRPLGSIALEVGFSAQSDFSRVFRQRYGMAPSRWDRRSRLDPQTVPDYAENMRRVIADGFEPKARLVRHPACRLAYVRMQTPFLGEPLRAGYARLTRWLEARGIPWRERQLLGMSWDNYETTPLDQVRFDFGFTVGPEVQAEDDIGIHVLPAVQAVEVHCLGELSTIAVAWNHLYDEWLPASDFEPADLPGIKRFRRRPDELGWSTWDVDCSIAVRPLQP